MNSIGYYIVTSDEKECLEAIFRNSKISDKQRINFLAAKTDISPSDTARTVTNLKKLGLVNYEKYGLISLTSKGKILAEKIFQYAQTS